MFAMCCCQLINHWIQCIVAIVMQISPQKHVRLSPRPSTSFAPYPSPTYTSAIAAAQHSVNVALGLQNTGGFTGSPNTNNIRASSSITILNNNNSMHHSQSPHNAHHLQVIWEDCPPEILPHSLLYAPLFYNLDFPILSFTQPHTEVLNLSHSAPTTSAPISGATSVIHRSPLSPNRRPRGENKKCRKQYGMEKKELWCTQCKWKKACSRFGDWKRPKSSTSTAADKTMTIMPRVLNKI